MGKKIPEEIIKQCQKMYIEEWLSCNNTEIIKVIKYGC